MILVDVNLLVYAHFSGFPEHEAAYHWLNGQLNGTAPVGLPWPSLLGFVRVGTNPRVFERPETIESAWRQVGEWLDCSPSWIPHPTEHHRQVLGSLLAGQGLRGDLVPDVHLAALAIEHGLTLCSTDGDFARFPGLKWENPLRR